jgi:acyltransferase
MNRLILTIYRFFERQKYILWFVLALIAVVLAFLASRIDFVEDISSFLPSNNTNRRISEAYQRIGGANKIIVTFSPTSGDVDETTLTEAATFFSQTVESYDNGRRIKELVSEIDNEQISNTTNFIIQNLPLYLVEDDYRHIDSLLMYEANIAEKLAKDREMLLLPMGAFMRNIIQNDPLMLSGRALKGLEVFRPNDKYETFDGFVFNQRGECMVTITSVYPSSETSENKLLAADIYKAVEQTEAQFAKEVKITPFGAALISITNAERIKADSIFAIGVSGVLIFSLLLYFFRSIRPIVLIVVSIGFGVLFSLGIIVLFKNTVSIIAIGIASIILGIAVNYPLHFLAHFKHIKAKEETLRDLINPLLIGNITTVGAFLSLLFISSEAMHDLGLFSALLLVGTMIFVLVFLPHILSEKKRGKSIASSETTTVGRRLLMRAVTGFSPENNKVLVIAFVVATIVLFVFSFGTKFDVDMHNINYMTAEQRQTMDKLADDNKADGNTVYIVAEGKNPDEALAYYHKYVLPELTRRANKQDTTIKKIAGIGNFFPTQDEQVKKIALWNDFWATRRQTFVDKLQKASRLQGFAPDAFDGFIDIINREYTARPFAYFYDALESLAENYINIDDRSTMIFSTIYGRDDEQAVAKSFDTDNIYVFDNSSFMKRMVTSLSDDFNKVLYICGFVVFVFLLFSFGRIEIALITFVPLAVGWIWILGLMNIFDIQFNIVNIILATFIFGQGDDYTIFITEGLIHEYTYRRKMLDKFKVSIVLSATILLVAVGILIFAKHPAMRSLAELTIVGMITVVVCAYILPPLLYKWLVYGGNNRPRIMPITLWNMAKTVFSFAIFVVAAVIMSITGFFILTIGGKSDRNKELFHKILCRGLRIFAYMMPQVKHTVNNPYGTAFDKPSVIIANHQSHLDLLYILMLSPKIIALTNRWTWHNPFYGIIIRYADFVPVENGIEENMGKIRMLVDKGYSVLVFPEGSRSEDCSIGRFRQGAFYLAKVLRLDIVPIVLHGVGHILPKKEFVLRRGQVDVVIDQRISLADLETTLSQRDSDTNDLDTRAVAKYFCSLLREKYDILADKVETPQYFADKVMKNYIYKGSRIARIAKKELQRYGNYSSVISTLPDRGKILIKNCGQGVLPLMAALIKRNLTIEATEADPDKLDIACNCHSIPKNLVYIDHIDPAVTYDKVIDCLSL